MKTVELDASANTWLSASTARSPPVMTTALPALISRITVTLPATDWMSTRLTLPWPPRSPACAAVCSPTVPSMTTLPMAAMTMLPASSVSSAPPDR